MNRRRYILTIEVAESPSADQVERVLMMAADKLEGRLTRNDFKSSNAANDYLTRIGGKTLRKMGE